MKTLTTLIISSVLIMSVTAKAENNYHYDYATVMQSKPVYRIVTVTGQKKKCRAEEVVYQRPGRKNKNSSLIGGILGAAVGHALGHRSKHRTGATIAGAIVGSSIARNHQPGTTTHGIENRCRMVPISWEEERIVGYNVVYRYNGRTFETQLPYEPADSLKIRINIAPIANSSGDLD